MLTNENYHSVEMNRKYMGTSQFKSFCECEYKALAEINGKYVREQTPALLVGSFVDSHFGKELDIFKAKNADLFAQKGELKSQYKHAEYIIERIERDEMMKKYLSGEQQVIKTGEIMGIPFKIKIDSYHAKKAIVDLKIMKDFEPIWKPEQGKMNFIEAWGYDYQGAIYQEIERGKLPFFIVGATKEKEPDIGIFQITQNYLDTALELVKEKIPRFQAIKNGEIEPERCDHCDWCKFNKIITEIKTVSDLDG